MSENKRGPVLLVEDDQGAAMLFTEVLKSMGEEVIAVRSVLAARGLIKRPDIQIVLMDGNLLDGSSLELVEDIRRTRPGSDLYLISISGDDMLGPRMVRLGCNMWVRKPFDVAELMDQIEKGRQTTAS